MRVPSVEPEALVEIEEALARAPPDEALAQRAQAAAAVHRRRQARGRAPPSDGTPPCD